MTLRDRQYSIFESCYWSISAEDYEYKDDGYIEIIILEANQTDVFLYTGTDRRNLTSYIDDDEKATVGTPFRIPMSEKALLIA